MGLSVHVREKIMKKEDVTYETKIGELRLDFKNPNSKGINFIFLEGVSDVRLFRKFFDLDKCKVESIPGGNSKLEECIATLLSSHALIVAIRDADFIRMTNPSYRKNNIILTDFHDIEMTILSHSESLNALLTEYTSIDSSDFSKIRNILMNLLSSISLLKLNNDINSRKLKFESGFIDLLDFNNMRIDISQYISRILSKSTNATITDKQFLQKEIETTDIQNYDLLQLTNGHDLTKVLASFFNQKHGHKGVSDTDIESNLRISFNMDIFKRTSIYKEILNWEQANNTSIFVV